MNRLRFKDYLVLLGLCVLIYLWLLVDQFFLPTVKQRFIALLVVSFSALTAYFFIVKPAKPFGLAKHLSLLLGLLTAAVTVLQHVIIRFDLTYKAVLILAVVVLAPCIAGGIYQLIPLNRPDKSV